MKTLMENPDIIGAFAQGFANSFVSGYSTTVICYWIILLLWAIYEYPKVKYGWIYLLLCQASPLVLHYTLIIRANQLKSEANA